MAASEKVMFEIYREAEYNRRYRVVYYTELSEHNRDFEINHALAGEHVFDGFLKDWRKDEAKQIIADYVKRLNEGEPVDNEGLCGRLTEYLA